MSTREASDLSQRVAAELRAARARLGFRWTDVEKATGIAHGTMHRMLQGEVDIPVARLMLICEAAGLDVAEVIEDATRKAPYRLHDLLTGTVASPAMSQAAPTVENIQQRDWNEYTGRKAADVDDEVQTDA